MLRCHGLRDDQWRRIAHLLPGQKRHAGATARDNRLFVDAVLYRYRLDIAWRDLPAHFGDFRVVHTRFCRWRRAGIWRRLFQTLAQDADEEYSAVALAIARIPQRDCIGPGADPFKDSRRHGG
ncbi:transposase [Stenotrophomonas humi]